MPPRSGGLANSQRTRPPRRNNRVASNNRESSASASPLPSTGGNGEVRSVLDGLDQNELTMLLSISQPSEMLEKVLGAVLMMVSPYSPHEVDCSWGALQDWLQVIGGPTYFVHNLRNFNLLTVKPANAQACHQFLTRCSQLPNFSEQALSRVSPVLSTLYEWVGLTVATLLPVAQESAARWCTLRVGLDIADPDLRAAILLLLQQEFAIEAVDDQAALPPNNPNGLVLAQLPTAELAAALHQHGCLPQLVLSDSVETGTTHEWVTSGTEKLAPAYTIKAPADMPELHNLILQLGTSSYAWPDFRVALLAPPGCNRKLLGEAVAAQYRLQRVCPAQQLQIRAEGGDIEAIAPLQDGQLAPDGLVADVIEAQLLSGAEQTERGLLLDGFPRTAGQAEALQKAGCAPQLVLMLKCDEQASTTALHAAKMATHEAHREELLSWFEQQGVLVVEIAVDCSAMDLPRTLGLLMHTLELHCAMLSVPLPIELQAAELPSIRSDPPHRLYSTMPEMVPCAVATVLTDALWSKLKLAVSPLGTTLHKCIEPCSVDVANAGEEIVGLVTCDEHSPSLFEPVFSAVLQQLHGTPVHDNLVSLLPHRLDETTNLSADHVRSICVSARRNLVGLPLSPSLNTIEITQIEQMLKLCFGDLCTSGSFGGRYWQVAALDGHQAACCSQVGEEFSGHMMAADVDQQLLQRLEQQRSSSCGPGIWVSADQCNAAWLQQEDHVRIFAYEPSSSLMNAFEKFVTLAQSLEDCVEARGAAWMHTNQYGFLTTCPSHWGTALRVSVVCDLPALVASGTLLQDCAEHGLMVCSEPAGGIVQLCNTTVFGKSEVAVFDSMQQSLTALIDREIELQESHPAAATEEEPAAATEEEPVAATEEEPAAATEEPAAA